MLEEAQTTIVVGRVKAGVGFGLGFILLVCAVFLFVKWKKGIGYTAKDGEHSILVLVILPVEIWWLQAMKQRTDIFWV